MKIYEGLCAIALSVNGEMRNAMVRPSDILLDVLREQFGLTGAKAGCRNGDCGACTVLMDGWPIKSCITLAVEAVGHEIRTVEGLGGDTPVQRAFVDADAFQCGYCTPGFLMVAHALSLQKPDADEFEMESWLASNLCRCTGYQEIREAVETVLKSARKGNTTDKNMSGGQCDEG